MKVGNITSNKMQTTFGVPQGSILGPILFLAMIADMPKYLKRDSLRASSRVSGYADDTTVYAKALNTKDLKEELEILACNMVSYCNSNGLILNSQKTQIITSTGTTIKVKIGQDYVASSQSIKLLGIEYDSNFTTLPYLRSLARDAKTRSSLIKRLSFCMPQCLLKPLAHGLVLGKILAAASAAIPIKIHNQGKPFQFGILEDINKAIKSTARTITRIKLTDKVSSNIVLWKAGLPSLNEAVSSSMASLIWKARNQMNPLGQIFKTSNSSMNTRSLSNEKLSSYVPGHSEAASNNLVKLWNVLDLKSAKSVTAAKMLANKHFKAT